MACEDFAGGVTNVTEWTDEQIEDGFSNCGGQGLPVNSPNLNGAFKWLQNCLQQTDRGLDDRISALEDAADLTNQITCLLQANPIGAGKLWFSNDIPDGFLKAGQSVSKDDYPELYTALGSGSVWGQLGNQFNLPPNDVFYFFGGAGRPVGTSGGQAQHTLTMANIPAHRHGMAHTHEYGDQFNDQSLHTELNVNGFGDVSTFRSDLSMRTVAKETSASSEQNTEMAGEASPDPLDNLPPFAVCNLIIYAGC